MQDTPWITIFWGEASESRAVLYARFAMPESQASRAASISGELHGPFAHQSHTLPARYSFRSRSRGTTSECLTECVVVDPCFWNRRVPSLYHAKILVDEPGRNSRTIERTIGIRRFGKVASALRWDDRQCVIRGITASTGPIDWQWCRDTGTTLVVESPADEICEAASVHGVTLMAVLPSQHVTDFQLEKLARWPAVFVVVVTGNGDALASRLRWLMPNVLVAQRLSASELDATVGNGTAVGKIVAHWADLVLVDLGELNSPADKLSSLGKPILVSHQGALNVSPDQARRACDELQARLGDASRLSGYIV